MVHLLTPGAIAITYFFEVKDRTNEGICFCPQSVQGRYKFSLSPSTREQKSEPRDKGDWFANHRTCQAQQWVCETEEKSERIPKQKEAIHLFIVFPATLSRFYI